MTKRTKTVVVTGAGGGIGYEICSVFAASGYKVVGLDILDQVRCQTNIDEFVLADLGRFCREARYRTRLVEEIASAVGKSGLDALINNAAVQILGGVEDITAEILSTSFDVNVSAPLLLTQSMIEQLESVQGSVVNVSSVHARATKPKFVAYATSKAALVGLTQAMAVDLGPRIRVNAIAPAATATPMLQAGFRENPELFSKLAGVHPMGRIAEPQEVAKAILFLASDDARFISGACLAVDGAVGVRLHDPE